MWWCGTCQRGFPTNALRDEHWEEFPDHGDRRMMNRSIVAEEKRRAGRV